MENKDYIQNINKAERRFMQVELRAPEKESRTVEGYAAVFNSDSELIYGSFIERIAPGAFDDVLNDDAVALFNHDPNLILARNKVNMTIKQDDKGLLYRFDAPNTTAGNDLLENLRLGNVRTSSFAFTIAEEKWTYSDDRAKPSIRTITKIERLFDVSPVTYPAYPDTSVAQRSFQSIIEAEERKTKAYLVEVMKRKHELFKLSHA